MKLPTWAYFLELTRINTNWDTPAQPTPSDTGRIEPGSDTWRYVTDWANEQLDALRKKNDNNKLDAAQTAEIRGQIKLAKKLLTLDKPKADTRRLSVEDED